MDTTFLRALASTIITAVLRFFTPSIEGILADFQKKIDQLNHLIDQTHDRADAARARRNALRDQLVETYDIEARCEAEAMRASKVRKKLEDIVNV